MKKDRETVSERKRKKYREDSFSGRFRRGLSYLKDYRFSRILVRYFLLLFVCLVLPATGLSFWYGRQLRENTRQEILRRNEASLVQAYDNVNSVILSVKNMASSLSRNSNVQYLATRASVNDDTTGTLDSLIEMLALIRNANDYIDSIYLYFAEPQEVVSELGVSGYGEFQDKEVLDAFSSDMPERIELLPRIKNNHYPYLLSILYPVSLGRGNNAGLVAINIDVEKLGDYIGSGRYRNTDYGPRLLIFDDDMETLVYSDEYRLLQEETELDELRSLTGREETFSGVCTLWDISYVVSEIRSEDDGLRYLYLSTMERFAEQNRAADSRMRNIAVLISVVCLLLASLLAVWVYRPIRKTIHLLADMSMLTEWDRKEHMDEIEAIQRSILSAKKERDDLNEQVSERLVSLHNAQICALQTQIDPHFLFNTLEVIGNTAALLFNGDNRVTEMIYTLGKMMRISLATENYLVPLEEELEHVKLYVKLVEFRYHGRVSLYQEIPEELNRERIVKLTLQPLIENAIQHGLAHKRSDGRIWLRGEKKGEDIYLYVTDNGMGISDEDLEKLTEQLDESSITRSRHIGMRNVDQRLKLIFGEEYGLSVSRSEEGGIRVTIHFRTV